MAVVADQLAAAKLRFPFPRAAADPTQGVRSAVTPGAVDEVPAAVRSTDPDPGATVQKSSTGSGLFDVAFSAVADALRGMRDFEALTAAALRRAFDGVLDGGRTGRFDVNTLGTAEKVYIATKITHELLGAWGFQPGRGTGLLIGGQEVTLKVTMGRTWTIAPGEVGTLCLLVSADDQRSCWSLGLIRIEPEHLIRGLGNRDGKRMLSAAGRQATAWLFPDAPLPENTLLHLPAPLREELFAPEAVGGSSQDRTNSLLRLVQGRVLNRTTIRTVALSEDAPKRVRDARNDLRREGILVLGGMRQHAEIARSLGLPEPRNGEWVSQRVTRRRPDHGGSPSVTLSGEVWTVAGPDDPVEEAPNPNARP
ncbi:NaeI family type II restriction endonuclease [Streptomyces sp. NPDC090741]|uniref:NaeI family type II restriction endonuclease n=1 Tax=Streptomyces sp. NPDC090741 TaxID=3365967 RepID=UPI0037FA79DD